MEFAYRPELWQGLFEMAALAAATLTGLLSVGLSIDLRTIRDSPMHRGLAREALIALTRTPHGVDFCPDPGAGASRAGDRAGGAESARLGDLAALAGGNRAPHGAAGAAALDHASHRPRYRHPGAHAGRRESDRRAIRWPLVAAAAHPDLPRVVHLQRVESHAGSRRSTPASPTSSTRSTAADTSPHGKNRHSARRRNRRRSSRRGNAYPAAGAKR